MPKVKSKAQTERPEQPAGPQPDVEKKKRNNNPGVRIQGGRIYDSENGTTCHQCRQKTAEVKAKCKSCSLNFCPACLSNRYGEQVEEVNNILGWSCPRCRGLCNCSNCRKKQGLTATGQLAGVSKTAGFGSVSALLSKNPHAKALPAAAPQAAAAAGAGGQEGSKAMKAQHKRRLPAELLDEAQLGPRPCPVPEPARLAVHKAGAVAPPGGKRQRGPSWLPSVPEVADLEEGVTAGELASVLEFLQVFSQPLKLKVPSLAALAAELLQPATAKRTDLLCSVPADSLVAHLHMRLIDVVREAWGFPITSSLSNWQLIMRGYYQEAFLAAQPQQPLQQGAEGPRQGASAAARQPPAVAGAELQAGSKSAAAREASGQEAEEQEGELAEPATAAAVEYPKGGYWGVAPGLRVTMLSALAHDALDTYVLRNYIESCMGDALSEDKERKTELAEVRKEAKEAIQQQRNKEIALLIANAGSEGLSGEEQRRLVEEARQRADAAAAEKAAAKLKALSGRVHPPTVRAAALGEDREGARLFRLQAGPLLAGGDGVLVQHAGTEDGTGSSEHWGAYPACSLPLLAASLDTRGRREGPLRHALISAFKISADAVEAAAAQAQQGQAASGSGSGKQEVQATEGKGRRSSVLDLAPAAGKASACNSGKAAAAAPKGAGKSWGSKTVAEPAAGRGRKRGTASPGEPAAGPVAQEREREATAQPPTKRARAGKAGVKSQSPGQAAAAEAASAAAQETSKGSKKADAAGGSRGPSRRGVLKVDDMLPRAQ